jgi:branched-chain amino acid transport system substrate-binding protein
MDLPPARLPRRRLLAAGAAAAWLGAGRVLRAAPAPVRFGFDGELGVEGSTSAQAIVAGLEIAAEEINAAGGLLGGRPLEIVVRDNRALPARAAPNLRELAALPDLVGVFCGRFSPTVLEMVPLVHELGLPLLDPWASADAIVNHGRVPSWTFRLAQTDAWAMPVVAAHARRHGRLRLGLIAVNTAWGRSAERALQGHLAGQAGGQRLVGARWYNYTDPEALIASRYLELRQLGAQAIVFIGNHSEGSELVRVIAAQPAAQRLPVAAASGIMGGDFAAACGPALQDVDITVVQTFGFAGNRRAGVARVEAQARRKLGDPAIVPSPAGVAQAYDLAHITARAVEAARSTARPAVRDALERSRPWRGLVRDYAQPFTATRHEALAPGDLYMARFDAGGALVRAR